MLASPPQCPSHLCDTRIYGVTYNALSLTIRSMLCRFCNAKLFTVLDTHELSHSRPGCLSHMCHTRTYGVTCLLQRTCLTSVLRHRIINSTPANSLLHIFLGGRSEAQHIRWEIMFSITLHKLSQGGLRDHPICTDLQIHNKKYVCHWTLILMLPTGNPNKPNPNIPSKCSDL